LIPVLACSAGLIWFLLSLLAPLVDVIPDLSVPFGVPACVDPDAVLPAPVVVGVLAVFPFGVGG
jgi:hypothetical protein